MVAHSKSGCSVVQRPGFRGGPRITWVADRECFDSAEFLRRTFRPRDSQFPDLAVLDELTVRLLSAVQPTAAASLLEP